MTTPFLSASNAGPPDRFQLLVEAVSDYGIFLLDTEGRITSWNTGAQLIKQYTAAEVMGRHFSMFYLPEDVQRQWPQEELRRAQKLGRFEDEGWRLRKDGTRFWANVVITALKDPSGQLTGYAKVTRDLSERRIHEETLRISEERFRLLVEGVKEYAVFMLDPSGVIQSWNPGAELLKGWRASEAIGMHFSIFYQPQDIRDGKPEADLAKALAEGRTEEEGWRLRKNGSAFWANVVISPIHDEEKQLRGFAKVTRDMTDRRRLEELERSSRRMNEFLAMLAHELRNPLAPIRNAVTVLQLEPGQNSVVRGSRDVIDRQLTHLTRLVDDLLDVGRLNTGKITLSTERISYTQIVARAVEAVRPLMDARRHRLTVALDGDLHVVADETRLVQVLQNLLVNAVKFTPDGGDIVVSAHLEGMQLVSSVRDSGIGLTREAISRIFDLFSQAEGAGNSRESGLGIGLTLARSLVEMHGGTLSAQSAGPGCGSEFTLVLPNADAQVHHEGEPGGVRCLIVDDNRDAADSMTAILRLLGYSAKAAYDGASALEIAREFQPQVALLDFAMPGMRGDELLGKMRKLPRGPSMLIGVLTGFGTAEDRARSMAMGFDEHMTKPLDLTVLQEFLARHKEPEAPPDAPSETQPEASGQTSSTG